MSDNEHNHLAIAEEKLRHFLALAEEILSLRETIRRRLDEALASRVLTESFRNRILIGLYLKALDCFDRLIIDARDRRGEASHHLKTMAECFIYSHWVSRENGETRAKLLSADGYRSRAAYHDSLEEIEYAAEWREMQRQQIEELQSEWKAFKNATFEQLASSANLGEHYHKIYRLACEAAHMGDLMVYAPPHPQEPGLRLPDLSMLRAYVVLKFGIILACDLLHDASNALGIALDSRIDGFRDRWRAIIAMERGGGLVSQDNGGSSHLLTNDEKSWLWKVRLMNRLLWGVIACDVLVALLTHVGLPESVAGTVVGISSPIFIGFILFVFFNFCPRCGKNFFVTWKWFPFGYGNPFSSRCLNCGLSWKDL